MAGEQLEERRLLSATHALPQLPVAIDSRVAAEVATFLPGGGDSSRSQAVPHLDLASARTAASRVQQVVDADSDDEGDLGKRPIVKASGSKASASSSDANLSFKTLLGSGASPSGGSSSHSAGSRTSALLPNGLALGGRSTFMTVLTPAAEPTSSPRPGSPAARPPLLHGPWALPAQQDSSPPQAATVARTMTVLVAASPRWSNADSPGPRLPNQPPQFSVVLRETDRPPAITMWTTESAPAREADTSADTAQDAASRNAEPASKAPQQPPADASGAPPLGPVEAAAPPDARHDVANVEAESCDQSLADAAAPGGPQTAEAELAKAAASQVLEATRPSPSGVDALLSEACAALAAEISTDLAAVDAALGELLDDIEDLGAGVVDTLGQFGAAPWITVATVGIAAYEHRRRRRAADSQVALADATIALFPELLGLPPAGER